MATSAHCAAHRAPASTIPARVTAAAPDVPPDFLLGNFEDDYGARFTVTASDFFQRSRNHFLVVHWDVARQFLIAQNDSANPSAPNKWTRIDWMQLKGMAPFEWAFCFSAFKAETRAEAEAASVARRDTPLKGCNGFPFSRMKRTP